MSSILVVEDDFDAREMLRRRLEQQGFTVFCATDGPAGVTIARFKRPELILMDIALGEMNGWDATRLIKADPRTAGIPVIAISGHALPSDRHKSIMVGCCDFEPKPVDFPRLVQKIKMWLERPPSESPGLAPNRGDEPRVQSTPGELSRRAANR